MAQPVKTRPPVGKSPRGMVEVLAGKLVQQAKPAPPRRRTKGGGY